MPDIYVRFYRGIDSADLSFNRIALVGAPNRGGKSSLAEAVRAALTADPLPLDGAGERLTQKESAPLLVAKGQEKGSVVLALNASTSSLTWPNSEYVAAGERPPRSSRIAAGLESLATMKAADRALFLINLLKALPTKEELMQAVDAAELGSAEAVVEDVWKEIQRIGWDAALKDWQTRGAERKGQWRETTGDTWGADKAANWAPVGWNPKWDALTVEQAVAGTAHVAEELVEFDKHHVRLDMGIDQLKILAEMLPDLEAQVLPDTTALGESLVAAETARAALPPTPDEAEEIHPCPLCQGGLAVAMGATPPWRLPTVSKPTKKAVEAMRERIAAANANVCKAKNALAQAHVAIAAHRKALEAARGAKEKLQTAQPPTGEAERADLVGRLRRANEVGGLIRTRLRAAALDAQIREGCKMIAILKPEGLRQTKLADVLQAFNDTLRTLSEYMGLVEPVSIRPDMTIWDDRPYWLMSGSQKFRARIILQCTVAHIDGSAMVVIDSDVDQDKEWLKGTLQMLRQLAFPALITVHADTITEMPPAPPAASGHAIYWIVDHVVRKLETAENGNGH